MIEPMTEPMWIIGPSGPTGKPDPTARPQLANLAKSTETVNVLGMMMPVAQCGSREMREGQTTAMLGHAHGKCAGGKWQDRSPLRNAQVSGMPDPAAQGSMKMMMAAEMRQRMAA